MLNPPRKPESRAGILYPEHAACTRDLAGLPGNSMARYASSSGGLGGGILPLVRPGDDGRDAPVLLKKAGLLGA
jgi:hypothetical protein